MFHFAKGKPWFYFSYFSQYIYSNDRVQYLHCTVSLTFEPYNGCNNFLKDDLDEFKIQYKTMIFLLYHTDSICEMITYFPISKF